MSMDAVHPPVHKCRLQHMIQHVLWAKAHLKRTRAKGKAVLRSAGRDSGIKRPHTSADFVLYFTPCNDINGICCSFRLCEAQLSRAHITMSPSKVSKNNSE